MIATSSLASVRREAIAFSGKILSSTISSSQSAVSSASSSTTPILKMNSARDRVRHVARQFAATLVPLRTNWPAIAFPFGVFGSASTKRITRMANCFVRSLSSCAFTFKISNPHSEISNQFSRMRSCESHALVSDKITWSPG